MPYLIDTSQIRGLSAAIAALAPSGSSSWNGGTVTNDIVCPELTVTLGNIYLGSYANGVGQIGHEGTTVYGWASAANHWSWDIDVTSMHVNNYGDLSVGGNLALTGILTGDVNGYLNVENGINFHYSATYITGGLTNGNYCITFSGGDVVMDGNLNVGRVSGGLSVNGIIGLTGDLTNNCFIQFGTGTVSGALRIAKTADGVFSMQDYTDAGHTGTFTWQLCTLNVSQLDVDHLNSASGGDIYLFKNLRLYYSGYNVLPYANNDGNLGGNGTNGFYYWGSVWANYVKYHTSNTSFDSVDDLDLVRKFKTTTHNGKDIIHPDTTKHLQDKDGFYELGAMNGWHLSVQKKLLDEIDQLRLEVNELKHQLTEKHD